MGGNGTHCHCRCRQRDYALLLMPLLKCLNASHDSSLLPAQPSMRIA